MSAQIGIPKYKDLLNREKLESLKKLINNICIVYGKLANKDSIENRESDNFAQYKKQYEKDIISLNELCNFSQQLLNEGNNSLFTISTRCVENHIYPEQ